MLRFVTLCLGVCLPLLWGCESSTASRPQSSSTTEAKTTDSSATVPLPQIPSLPAVAPSFPAADSLPPGSTNDTTAHPSISYAAPSTVDLCTPYLQLLRTAKAAHLLSDRINLEKMHATAMTQVQAYAEYVEPVQLSTTTVVDTRLTADCAGAEALYKQVLQQANQTLAKTDQAHQYKPRSIKLWFYRQLLKHALDAFDVGTSYQEDDVLQRTPQMRWAAVATKSSPTYGLGIRFSKSAAAHYQSQAGLRIEQVLACSPLAHRVQTGDRLVGFNGQSLKELSAQFVEQSLQGRAPTAVKLEIQSQQTSTSQQFDVTTQPDCQALYSAAEYPLVDADKLAYVTFDLFETDSEPQFEQLLQNWENQSEIAALIIDLRDNRGGAGVVAQRLASAFLPAAAPIYSTFPHHVDETHNREHYFAIPVPWAEHFTTDWLAITNYSVDTQPIFSKPVFIIVSEHTASAAEIFTATLTDHQRARVFGNATTGKGIGQIPITAVELLDDIGKVTFDRALVEEAFPGSIHLTTSKAYPPSGHDIHRRGNQVDLVLEEPGIADLRVQWQDKVRNSPYVRFLNQPWAIYFKEYSVDYAMPGPIDVALPAFKPAAHWDDAAAMQAASQAVQQLAQPTWCRQQVDCVLAMSRLAIAHYLTAMGLIVAP